MLKKVGPRYWVINNGNDVNMRLFVNCTCLIIASCDRIFVCCTLYCQSSVTKGRKSNYQMVSMQWQEWK